jgi:hypothetical protein
MLVREPPEEEYGVLQFSTEERSTIELHAGVFVGNTETRK